MFRTSQGASAKDELVDHPDQASSTSSSSTAGANAQPRPHPDPPPSGLPWQRGSRVGHPLKASRWHSEVPGLQGRWPRWLGSHARPGLEHIGQGEGYKSRLYGFESSITCRDGRVAPDWRRRLRSSDKDRLIGRAAPLFREQLDPAEISAIRASAEPEGRTRCAPPSMQRQETAGLSGTAGARHGPVELGPTTLTVKRSIHVNVCV